jgi:hypothetical protein
MTVNTPSRSATKKGCSLGADKRLDSLLTVRNWEPWVDER